MGLRARAQTDVPREDTEENSVTRFEPDVAVVKTETFKDAARHGGMALAIQPITIRHLLADKRRRWVQILDSSDGNRVVTTIEILSPGNKLAGKLNKAYREKLDLYLEGDVNVVEIDLLRSSRIRLAVPVDEIPEDRREAYYTSICRATDPWVWFVYPMSPRNPLPPIPIPCRPRDKDVTLELQPIIDRIYLEGTHDDLDYTEPPEPPLGDIDAAWAGELNAQRNSSPDNSY